MNIELDDIVLQDFSDDELERAAGGTQLALGTVTPCNTPASQSCTNKC